MKEKEEITKPPTKQATRAPLSLKGRALFHKGAPSTIYLHLSTSPNFPPQPATSADSSPPITRSGGGPHTPPPPFGMESSIAASWPQYGLLTTSQAVTMNPRSQWSLFEFGNRLNCEEFCIQKFSCSSGGRGAFCTGLPDGLPIKEDLGDLVVSLQPAIDTATPLVDTT
jgi:hypothetical protein